MSEVLLTQEVGSLAKPSWRVAAVAGNELNEDHAAEAIAWSGRLGLDITETEDIFCQARSHQRTNDTLGHEHLSRLRNLAAQQAIALQEKAGLDIINDGEQDRSEMYQYAVARTGGFEPRGLVRVFDDRYYRKFAVTGRPGIVTPWHVEEARRLTTTSDKQVKIPITGAYTLADWSYNEAYGSKRDLIEALATNVIRPNLQALLDVGIDWIQIDEPAAGARSEEIELFVESFNVSTEGLLGKFSIHLCFSQWDHFFPEVEDLANCHQLSIEFANRDADGLGVAAKDRPSYEVLKQLKDALPHTGVGLGVVSIHEDSLEDPLLVRDRVLRAVDLLEDPAKVYPSPDCGLRTRSWNVAYEKLARTVEGTNLAKQELGV